MNQDQNLSRVVIGLDDSTRLLPDWKLGIPRKGRENKKEYFSALGTLLPRERLRMTDIAFDEDTDDDAGGGGDQHAAVIFTPVAALNTGRGDPRLGGDEGEEEGGDPAGECDADDEGGDDGAARNPLAIPDDDPCAGASRRGWSGGSAAAGQQFGVIPSTSAGYPGSDRPASWWQDVEMTPIISLSGQLQQSGRRMSCPLSSATSASSPVPGLFRGVRCVAELPLELLVTIMSMLSQCDLLSFRASCRRLNETFYGTAMDTFSDQLRPPLASWHMTGASPRKRNLFRVFMYKRNLQQQRQMRKTLKERARLGGLNNALQFEFHFVTPKPKTVLQPASPTNATGRQFPQLMVSPVGGDMPLLDAPVPSHTQNPLAPPSSLSAGADAPPATGVFSTSNPDEVAVTVHPAQPLSILPQQAEEPPPTSPMISTRLIGPTAAKSFRQLLMMFMPHQEPLPGPTGPQIVKSWLDELALQRRVRQNIARCLFDKVVIEKQSHAAPLLLPCGTMFFSRWHLVAVYVRTTEKDINSNPIPNTAKWIKTGYLGSHTETITSMRYDAFHSSVFTASFDGSIRRWAVRDDSPISAIGGRPSSQQGLFRCLAAYRVSINGLPASNFSIFSFDLTHLRDYKWATDDKKDKLRWHAEQQQQLQQQQASMNAATATASAVAEADGEGGLSSVQEAHQVGGSSHAAPPPSPGGVLRGLTHPINAPVLELLNEGSSLMCCGSEWGYVALMHIDRRNCTTLGLYSASDSRVRQVRFVNKRPFSDFVVSETATDEFIEGISAPPYAGPTSGFIVRNVSNAGMPINAPFPQPDAATVPYISPECPPTGTVQSGTVHIVASTFTGVAIMSHRIYRRVVEMVRDDGRTVTIRKGFHYFSTSLQMETLHTFSEVALYVDTPKMWWHRAPPGTEKLPDHCLAAEEARRAATSNVQTISDDTSEGHPYLTAPIVLVVYRRERSCLLRMNAAVAESLNNPGAPSDPSSRPAVYESMLLPLQTSGATCGKISPAHAVIAVGTDDGRVLLISPLLRQVQRSEVEGSSLRPITTTDSGHHGEAPDVPASHDVHSVSTSLELPQPQPHASIENPLPQDGVPGTPEMAWDEDEGATDRIGASESEVLSAIHSDNINFFGPAIQQCPLVKSIQERTARASRAHIAGITTDSFVVLTMSQSFGHAVVSVEIDGWKLSAIDTHATVLVFNIFTEVLMIHMTPIPSPNQINLCSASLITNMMDMDCSARPNNPRHIVWSNGTLLITPLPVTSHSVVADFTGVFHHVDYVGAVDAATEASKAAACGGEDDDEIDSLEIPEPAVVMEPGGKWADSSSWLQMNFREVKAYSASALHLLDPSLVALVLRRVQMQRFPALFHVLYICSPPMVIFLICIFMAVLAARLDGHISIPFGAVFLLHFAQLPHYFGINFYSYKPLMVHHSGPSFFVRLVADVCYLVVFPIVFIIRHDTSYLDRVSWLFLSSPLLLAIICAFIAARMEDRFEQRHRVALDPPLAAKRYRDTAVIQFLQTAGIIAFVAMFSIYFDDPKGVSATSAVASLATSKLNIFVAFVPVWLFCLAYITQVHTLISYNPDPNRPLLSLVLYNVAVVGIHLAFIAVSFAPAYLFCLKYDNYYACSSWTPQNVTAGDNSTHFLSNGTIGGGGGSNHSFNTTTNASNTTVAPFGVPLLSTSPRPPCGALEHLSLIVVVLPMILALMVVGGFAMTNVMVHLQHIRRGMT
jgi:hypothetical protein